MPLQLGRSLSVLEFLFEVFKYFNKYVLGVQNLKFEVSFVFELSMIIELKDELK